MSKNEFKNKTIHKEKKIKIGHSRTPWTWLDQYRGTFFKGEWPTLKELFGLSAARYPGRLCWSCYGKDAVSYTYAEAESEVKRTAAWLLENGVTKNSHVGITGKNSPQWAMAFFAVLYAGATAVPLDNTLHENELANLIEFGDVDVVIGDPERLEYTKGLVGTVLSLEPSDQYPCILDVKAKEEKIALERAYAARPEDTAAILFTSGTTGKPKGVMLTHENLSACTYMCQGNMNICCQDVFYLILPIHHAYALQAAFLECMSTGAHMIFGKKPVTSVIFRDMKQGRVNVFLGVPMLYNRIIAGLMDGIREKGLLVYGLVRALMAVNGFCRSVLHINPGKALFRPLLSKVSFDRLRLCISGGGALPDRTRKLFRQLGLDFTQGYGMTETSPTTFINPIYAFRAGSVGPACPGVECRIENPDSSGNGLILLRGPRNMKGYYKDPEATAAVIDPDGWLNTGDVGHLDRDGYLYITGREKNVIVTEGGKKVFPEELEDMFQLYDDLEQVCIIPYYSNKELKTEGVRLLALPSKKLTDAVHGAARDIEKRVNEIVAEINSRLQSYKKITRSTVIDRPLAITSTKKIKRGEVMREYGPDAEERSRA